MTPHAVGVIVNKVVGGKILAKRVHVRVEHVVASRCREVTHTPRYTLRTPLPGGAAVALTDPPSILQPSPL